MSYTVRGYQQGRLIAEGRADDLSEVLKWVDQALHGLGDCPMCDEAEAMTEYRGKEILVAYVMDDDRALEEA